MLGRQSTAPEAIAIIVFAAAASFAQARTATARITGVIVSVQKNGSATLQVAASKGAEARTIHTDSDTSYTKWITHQPWQQDARRTASSLVEGRCVEVQLRGDRTDLAKAVRISDEPAGSVFDPCKSIR